ncbi:MAG: imelysin family protein [Bacteroidota bacterium]
MRKNSWWAMLLVMFFFGCSSDGDGGSTPGQDDDVAPISFDRGPMLQNWADKIILPAYQSFSLDLQDLKTSYDTFAAERTTQNLGSLRDAWETTYSSWQQVSMFEIGPAEALGFRLNMNTYPVDVELVENYISSGNYDLTVPSSRDAKGFPALDYLFNGLETDDNALVLRFDSGADSGNRLAYVGDVIGDMISLTEEVISQWDTGYRDTFVSNDGSSATATTDKFVNDFIFYYEKFLRAGKMGIPLGVFTGTPASNTIEAFYKEELSQQFFLTGLQAVQDFFNGKHFGSSATGESLASYLRSLNEVKDGVALDAVINNQLDEARELVTGLGTFRQEIENNNPPTNMLLAYDEVQRVVPLFKVDMVSAMSISIDFVDADGD